MNITRNGKKSTSNALMPELTVAEFFAGIGLMRLGLESEGWRVIYSNDIDPEKLAQYNENFGISDHKCLLGDIHEIDPATVPTVTLATASFPCTDLSLAGERKGLGGKQSSAFWGFVNILSGMSDRRPPLVLIENVMGFLTSNQGKDFSAAMSALNALGYVVDTFMIDAARFVPQSRRRLFIVGIQDSTNDDDQFGKNREYIQPTELRPKALIDFVNRHRDIQWRLRSLPSLPQRLQQLSDIIEDLAPDAPEWWNRERSEYLFSQLSPRHRALATHIINQQRWTYGTAFRRMRNGKSMAELRLDGIAGCLRTPKGGSGRQIIFKAGFGDYNVRLLTPREAARLMGADNFSISGSPNRALFGFGDAVCVPVVEWIARHYLIPKISELTKTTPTFHTLHAIHA